MCHLQKVHKFHLCGVFVYEMCAQRRNAAVAAAAKFAWPQIIDNIFCFSTACYCILLCSYCIHWYLCTTDICTLQTSNWRLFRFTYKYILSVCVALRKSRHIYRHTHTHKFYGTHIYMIPEQNGTYIFNYTIHILVCIHLYTNTVRKTKLAKALNYKIVICIPYPYIHICI